jgi:hypothetical protein
VKGFDFAKQHLGQHNKDDILIIHEPAPLPGPVKDHTTPSENGDVPSPKSKLPSKNIRLRGRLVLRFLDCSLLQTLFPLSWLILISETQVMSIALGRQPGGRLTSPVLHINPEAFSVPSAGPLDPAV